MNPLLESAIQAIVDDRTHGAGWLAREAVKVMERVARASAATTLSDFVAELRDAANRLGSSRPSMAPLRNEIAELFWRVLRQARDEIDAAALKAYAVNQARRLVVTAERDAMLAAEKAAELLSGGEGVLTGSYSATVAVALRKAFKRRRAGGGEMRIFVARSECAGIAYGPQLVEELGTAGMAATVIADKDIARYAREAAMAVTGADSILADGSVVNGCPTLEIAKAIVLAGAPFYVVGETAKVFAGTEVRLEPGFDLVPGELVSGVMSERGMLDAPAVSRMAAKWKRMQEALGA